MNFSKIVTTRFKPNGLFAQIFTPANFGENAEQVTFWIFWSFVKTSADISVRFFPSDSTVKYLLSHNILHLQPCL